MTILLQVSSCVPSTLKCYALRLGPGEEIKSCLLEFVKLHNLQAAFILTCAGSVQKAKIRLANATATDTNNSYRSLLNLSGCKHN